MMLSVIGYAFLIITAHAGLLLLGLLAIREINSGPRS